MFADSLCRLAKISLAMGLAIFIGATAYAQTPRHRLDVDGAWIRRPTKTTPEARAFFVVLNNTGEPEYLTGVSSPGGKGKLSETRWRGMRPYVVEVKSIEIPAYGKVELKAGGYYVALPDSAESLPQGRSLTLTLHFESSGNLDVAAEISNRVLGKAREQ